MFISISGLYKELGESVDVAVLDKTEKEIPDKYKKLLTSKSPDTNVRDGREEDVKTMLMYEKYILYNSNNFNGNNNHSRGNFST